MQKQRSRSYRGLDYYKYRVTIPVQIAGILRLEGGERLDVYLEKNKIVIQRPEARENLKKIP